jgi:DNA-binding protein HU-beta
MNKTEFIEAVAEKAGLTKADAKKAVNAFCDVVTEKMEDGEKITIIGFGTFSVTERSARTGVNPQTGKKMNIAARKVVKFKPGSGLDLNK